MPCHSPLKTSWMRSSTVAEPSELIPIVSWKSEICQSFARAGASRRSSESKSCREREERVDASTLELDRHVLTFCGAGDFEELALLETEHARQNVCREGLDLCIQVAHDGVVVPSRILNIVFSLAQLGLQSSELFRSAQLGIVFCNRKQALQGPGKL